jgi:peptidoglycan hydrolase-like protein with peptidoglycan-binding domain
MKLSSILVAAAMTLAACQMLPEKSVPAVPPAAAVQVTREQIEAREAQTGLKKLGYYRSRIDGIAGPRTSAAVQRSRTDFGLEPTGAIDGEFLGVMTRYLDLNPPRKGIPLAADVFAAQRGLKRLGYYSGRVNGFYDRATLAAVIAYRRKNGLPITEQIEAKLLRQIESDTTPAAAG